MTNQWKTKKKMLKKAGWEYSYTKGIQAWQSPRGELYSTYILDQFPLRAFPQIVEEY